MCEHVGNKLKVYFQITTFKNRNYDAWKKITTSEKITAAEFIKFAQKNL